MNFQLIISHRNPISRILESLGVVDKRLVGHYEISRNYDFELITQYGGSERERVVFFLFEYPSGRRTYEVLDYGYSAQIEAHAEYLPEIMLWVHGGQMPSGTTKIGSSEPAIVKLAVVRSGPAA